jgi:uncharacterized membrane protein
MDGFIIAKIIHILGVVFWIGGVAMVTTVILPAVKKFKSLEERVEFFEKVERRFQIQARVTTMVTGLSGIYMLEKLDAWYRFLLVSYWWMWAMVIVWLIFTLMLFVIEPFILKEKLIERAKTDPEGTFRKIQKMHAHLLWISLLTIIGAVAGGHGWLFF